jgi:superfamily II DNA or RNA helicase
LSFLGRERLLFGPWSAFERAFVRYFLHLGYPQVEYTGGPGDKGCDILVVSEDLKKRVIQCKFSYSSKPANKSGVDDLQRACISYDADGGILCINSKTLAPSAYEKLQSLNDEGFNLDLWRWKEIKHKMEYLPEYSLSKKELRNYQKDAVRAAINSLKASGRALVEMATGLGKTVVMAEVISKFLQEKSNLRVLILARSNPLISQGERAIWSQLPKHVMTHILSGSEKPIIDSGITVSTFDSLKSDLKNNRDIPEFDLVVVDECHWAHAESYAEVIDVVSRNCMLMGVTATPWRGDKKDITEIFGDPIFKKGIIEGISEGWLANIDYKMFHDDINWDLVTELSKESHTIKSLNSKLFLPSRDEEQVEKVIAEWDSMDQPKLISFCQTVSHAKRLCDVFNKNGLPSRIIVGDHTEKERAEIFTDFRMGKFSNLIGVDILNEGVDIPDVELVVFCRLTHSRRIFIQQLGRGLRVTDSKDRVKVLDFVADIRRLGALAKLNRAAKNEEVYRDTGADNVNFGIKLHSLFVEEYLADVADLDEFESPKLDFINPEHPDIINLED